MIMPPASIDRFGIEPPAEGRPRPARASGWSQWVPIRTLGERHRPLILDHLLQLDAQDRHLRFGVTTTDEQIRRYVASINFDHDEVFGVFDRRLRLIALAHLAYPPPRDPADKRRIVVEFGVSVLTVARGKGYGNRLFQHSILHARNRGVHALFIHALTENAAMLRIAAKAGATLEYDGPDAEAWLKLPSDTVRTHLDETLLSGAAELNYRAKVQVSRLRQLWSRWLG
jgi:RimJ/RimL family protein N-acetyltransferase